VIKTCKDMVYICTRHFLQVHANDQYKVHVYDVPKNKCIQVKCTHYLLTWLVQNT
jgi:hypothetical protein